MPGDIVIGPATYEATRDRFEVAQLGYFALKGVSTQVPLYKLLGEKEADDLELAGRPKSKVRPR